MKRIIVLSLTLALGMFLADSAHAQLWDEPQVPDNFYEKSNTKDRTPRAYVPVREADVFIKWRVWRAIDLRMKMNQYLYFPTVKNNDRISLINLILEGIQSGVLTPYEGMQKNMTWDCDFSKPLSYEEATKELILQDTGADGQIYTDARLHLVQRYFVKEDWFIDKQRGVRDIRIIGIAPVITAYDESGEFLGYQTLFWLYYPEARPLFAKTEAFNPHNSAMRQSYDDVFAWNRYFQSYIYKIDNLQNRDIKDYMEGIAELRESDRIEEMLFEIEHDLWVY
ncbi:MAG: gliding motility protein GldN [Bacteroidetes bacterium]|uniref:Gliding motility protein GldN n=1 Tax=Candidatus Pullibacteroides excrementavium TaxID=2840905 RepID=A0A9D9DS53_9BACT|nr:gliding motility protein GldN [Candidatus Pullibacteroides excrementavium]